MTYMASLATKRSIEDIAPISVIEELLRHHNKQIALCTIGLMRNLFYTVPLGNKDNSPPPVPDHSSAPSPLRLLRRFSRHTSSNNTTPSGSAADLGDLNQVFRNIVDKRVFIFIFDSSDFS